MTTVEERLSRLEGVYDHLSSKADVAKVETQIADLRTELKGDIAGLRTELKGDIAGLRTELKGDIAGLRTEIYRVNASSRQVAELALWQASSVVGARWLHGYLQVSRLTAFSSPGHPQCMDCIFCQNCRGGDTRRGAPQGRAGHRHPGHQSPGPRSPSRPAHRTPGVGPGDRGRERLAGRTHDSRGQRDGPQGRRLRQGLPACHQLR